MGIVIQDWMNHHGTGTIHRVAKVMPCAGDSRYEVISPELAKAKPDRKVRGVENVVLVYHREIRKRRITLNQISGIPLIPTPKPKVSIAQPVQHGRLRRNTSWKKSDRRLANQDLVDRFIRESERCIRS